MSQWDSKSFHDAVVSRDKDCQHCGNQELLQAHHILLRSNGGSDDPENGVALCAGCHADEHPDIPRNLFFIKAFGPYSPYGWPATYVAGLMNCHPRTVVRWAKRQGIARTGLCWAFSEDDLVTFERVKPRHGTEDSTQIVVKTPEEIRCRAKAKAALEGKSLSSIITAWIAEWLAETKTVYSPHFLSEEWVQAHPHEVAPG